MSQPVSKLPDGADVAPFHALYQATIGQLNFYALPLAKFTSLVIEPRTTIFIARDSSSPEILGFAVCVLIRSGSKTSRSGQHLKGGLSLLIVDPKHQSQGIGSALHAKAVEFLSTKVRESLHLSDPVPEHGSLQLGATFPRFFPGVPEGPEFEHAVQWFKKRGWTVGDDIAIDLYRSVEPGKAIDMRGLTERAEKHGVTFHSPKPEEDEALYALEKADFDNYTVGRPSPACPPAVGSELCKVLICELMST